jgi:hypothetical protein
VNGIYSVGYFMYYATFVHVTLSLIWHGFLLQI